MSYVEFFNQNLLDILTKVAMYIFVFMLFFEPRNQENEN